MFFISSMSLLNAGGRALAALLFLLLLAVGLLLAGTLCRTQAPLSVRLLPPVLGALALLLIVSLYRGWIFLPLPAYNTLVRGGLLRVWGSLAEGFVAGALLGGLLWRLWPHGTKKE